MADVRSIFYRTKNVTHSGISSSTTALAENFNRSGFVIVNLGQNVLYVKFGASASTTDFDIPLKAATANDDGTGGSLAMENGLIYDGIITIAGTSPRYVITEFT